MKNQLIPLLAILLALAGCGEKHADTSPFVSILSVPIPPDTVTESFHGSMCYEDTCYENKAGYEWARENKVTSPKKCEEQHEHSAYFQNGCIAFTLDPSDPPYNLNDGEEDDC